jgi:hypothetical protein
MLSVCGRTKNMDTIVVTGEQVTNSNKKMLSKMVKTGLNCFREDAVGVSKNLFSGT